MSDINENNNNETKENKENVVEELDELTYSTKNLKIAIPLMGKFGIPMTPKHYSVWYSYIAKANADLNAFLDKEIKRAGTCSPIISEEAYANYIATEAEKENINIKKGLEGLLNEIYTSLGDTKSGADDFTRYLDSSVTRLNNLEGDEVSAEDVLSVVKSVVKNISHIRKSTDVFSKRLDEANNEIMSLKKQMSKIKIEATQDALTGLLNRRSFDTEIELYVKLKKNFSLIMADLDHFKDINDRYGHRFGDSALKAVCKVIKERIGDNGRVYRYGGEEIAILVPNKNINIAKKLADVCRVNIEKITIVDPISENTLSKMTCSFGVSTFEDKNELALQVIERADHQLYLAKSLGRNRVMPLSL